MKNLIALLLSAFIALSLTPHSLAASAGTGTYGAAGGLPTGGSVNQTVVNTAPGAGTWQTLPVAGGGTGSTYGAGIAASSATTSAAAVTLTATSASIQRSTYGGICAYTLPDATTCVGKQFIFQGSAAISLNTVLSQTINNISSGAEIGISSTAVGIISDGFNWIQTVISFQPQGLTGALTTASYATISQFAGGVAGQFPVQGGNGNNVAWSNTVESTTAVSTTQTLSATSSRNIIATGTITITLTPTANKRWTIFNNDALVKTIAVSSGALLGATGAASITAQNSSREYWSDGTNIYCCSISGS